MSNTPIFQQSPLNVTSWAERNGFAHWAIAMIWLVLALILFQVVAGLVIVGYLFATGELAEATDVSDFIANNVNVLFIGNSIGQALFIGLASFVVVRLHLGGEKVRHFMRLGWDSKTPLFILLGSVLILVVQPIVMYLGYLNSLLPVPDYFSDLQVSQYEMIRQFLETDGVLLFGLFHIALIPAVCEEVLFRGYVLRAFEKSWGIIVAIVTSGIIFGLFHIQLGNILPLAALGMVLALMTWLSRSIWPAVAAHFINNGAAVLVGINFPELLFRDMDASVLPPWWLLLASIFFTILIIKGMLNQSDETTN